ncbi:Uncharacterised protein [Klebsiella pneumoniae]|nr:Uncharacterised protein [Klebsiella pneumoniae]
MRSGTVLKGLSQKLNHRVCRIPLLTVARRFSLQVNDLTIPLVDNGARLFELSYQRGLFGNVHAASVFTIGTAQPGSNSTAGAVHWLPHTSKP